MTEEGDPGLTNLFNQALQRLLEEHGFQLPLYATMIGSNGVMVMSRYDDVGDPRARAQIVAEYEPADVMTWPVHGLIVDTGGQGAHIVFPSPGVMEFRDSPGVSPATGRNASPDGLRFNDLGAACTLGSGVRRVRHTTGRDGGLAEGRRAVRGPTESAAICA